MKLSVVLSVIILCKTYSIVSAQQPTSSALPHVLVYKAKPQYRNLVPVQLSADKKSVVSYPDPADIKTGSGYPIPVLLHKGYWLDKRGIGLNTAFLRLTYEEYSKLKSSPTAEALYNMIVDKYPISELCDCGKRVQGKYTVKQLNELIDKKLLKKKCKVLYQ
jgi:hypothetical protein